MITSTLKQNLVSQSIVCWQCCNLTSTSPESVRNNADLADTSTSLSETVLLNTSEYWASQSTQLTTISEHLIDCDGTRILASRHPVLKKFTLLIQWCERLHVNVLKLAFSRVKSSDSRFQPARLRPRANRCVISERKSVESIYELKSSLAHILDMRQ